MTRAATFLLALAAAAAMVAGCSGTAGADRPTVVVTTNILGDVTHNIVGDDIDVRVLMPPGADPHSFQISAAQAARIESADLLISNGLGLEEGIAHTVQAARSEGVPILEVAPQVNPIPFDTHGDSAALDPHFWTDPDRVAAATESIRDAVVRHVPGVDRAAIDDRADAYVDRISDLTTAMTALFDSIPAESRRLVTNHHVFGYFAERFGFEVIGAVVPSGTTLASPSSADLAELSEAVRTSGVGAIFVDSSQPSKLADVLAKESGERVEVIELFTESLGDAGSGASSYLEMMETNATRITEGLK
ncbi:MAG: zinc ABC transporter substrate-binding protein [Rhodococcus sp.]|nr:zinc ABC transporter substrate-binding protein [Rhodococcus sp. (in: high G+C Gram-positive bacteria)]